MDWSALRVSLLLGLATIAVLLPAGVWAGHRLATRAFRGKALVEALVAIPLILPPTSLASICSSPSAPARRSAPRSNA